MRKLPILTARRVLLLLVSLIVAPTWAAADGAEDFKSMFDGKTMKGWKMVTGHKGHWRAVNGVIDYDGKSEAKTRAAQSLYSQQWYHDFTFKFEWRLSSEPKMLDNRKLNPEQGWVRTSDGKYEKERYLSAGDSGVYLRGTSQLQINLWCHPMGSGQVHAFMIDIDLPLEVRRACVPKKNTDRAPGEWNAMQITLIDNVLTVVQNGETVIDQVELPGRLPFGGPMVLQHHGDPIQFRNLYIREYD